MSSKNSTSLADKFSNYLEKHESRRAARWEKNSAAMQMPSLRTRSRQRALLWTFAIALVLALVVAFCQLFFDGILWLWFVPTALLIFSWTGVQITINSKDTAPASVLDEYEQAVLDSWGRASRRGLEWSLVLISFAMIALGTFAMPGDTPILGVGPAHWLYTLGLFTVVLVLTFASLPAVGYALTFGPDLPVSS